MRLAVVVAGLVGVGFSLRTLMASLPPLEPALRTDLGLSGAEIGVLTTVPVLCMGLFAPVAARVGHRFGAGRVVAAAVALVAVGNLLRGLGDLTWPLFLGTLVAGVGIALAGTLMPGLVKGFFPPHRTGLATGLTMFAMMGGAGVASAVTVPVADALGSWPLSLGLWGVIAALGLVAWLPVARIAHRRHVATDPPQTASGRLPWRSATALLVAAFMACQSVQFYSSLAWLAPTYVDEHWTPAGSGLLLALFTGAQLVSGLVGPWLTDKVRDERVLLLAACASGLAGELLGILARPDRRAVGLGAPARYRSGRCVRPRAGAARPVCRGCGGQCAVHGDVLPALLHDGGRRADRARGGARRHRDRPVDSQ